MSNASTTHSITLHVGETKKRYSIPVGSTARDVLLRAGFDPKTHAIVNQSTGATHAGDSLVETFHDAELRATPRLDVG